ncbi:MAG: hypothetical protein JWO38_934 [Gemmataceae bacterium]|nr:hypothetical protein [Gemmataceae bacterium]
MPTSSSTLAIAKALNRLSRPGRVRASAPVRYASYTHADFHRAIHANPGEATTGGAYADWLDEHGRPGLAEVVRRYSQTVGTAAHDYVAPWETQPLSLELHQHPTLGLSVYAKSAADPRRLLHWFTGPLHPAEAAPLVSRLMDEGATPPQTRQGVRDVDHLLGGRAEGPAAGLPVGDGHAARYARGTDRVSALAAALNALSSKRPVRYAGTDPTASTQTTGNSPAAGTTPKPRAGFQGGFGPLPGPGEGELLPPEARRTPGAEAPASPGARPPMRTTFAPGPRPAPSMGPTAPSHLDEPPVNTRWSTAPYRPPQATPGAGVTAGRDSGQVVIGPGHQSGDIAQSPALSNKPPGPAKPFVSPQRAKAQERARQWQEGQKKLQEQFKDAVNKGYGLGLNGMPRADAAPNLSMKDPRDMIDPATGLRDTRGAPSTGRPPGADGDSSLAAGGGDRGGSGSTSELKGHGFHPSSVEGEQSFGVAGAWAARQAAQRGALGATAKAAANTVAKTAAKTLVGRIAGGVAGGPVGAGLALGSLTPSSGHKDTHGLGGMSDDEIDKEIRDIKNREADHSPLPRQTGRWIKNHLLNPLGRGMFDTINWGQKQFTGKSYQHDDIRPRLTALEEELASRRAGRPEGKLEPSRKSRSLADALNRQAAIRYARDPVASPLLARLMAFLSRFAAAELDGLTIYVRPDTGELWIEVEKWAQPEVAKAVIAEASRIFGRPWVTVDDSRRPLPPQWIDVRELAEQDTPL